MDRNAGGEEIMRLHNIATYQALFSHLLPINQLLGEFNKLAFQSFSLPAENLLSNLKQGLVHRLEAFVGVLKRRPPLEDVENVPPPPRKKRKTGRKGGRAKEDQQKILLVTAIDLVRDEHCRSAYTYLMELDMSHLQASLYRLI